LLTEPLEDRELTHINTKISLGFYPW
jgi:hypothetical protein